jgi:aconitate hydratase
VREDDRIDLTGLGDLAPGSMVAVVLHHQDGSQESFDAKHTLTDEQIDWFKAGGAVNLIRQQERN